MLKDSLPQFVREMKEMAFLLGVDQDEIDRLEAFIEEMIKQFWISSATYSIEDWEKEFGIEKNSTLTLGQRRAQVLAKLNTRAPSTVKMMENLVIKVLGEQRVEVVEDHENYSFTIIINSDHVLENMLIASEAVRKARPAHLNYGFINKIARDSILRLYMAAAGRKVMGEISVVDTRRRKQLIYIGCCVRLIKSMEGDVEG